MDLMFAGYRGIRRRMKGVNIFVLCFQFTIVITFSIYRLYVGGFQPIVVESIRVKHGNKNYKQFIKALCYLDASLTGASMGELDVGKKDIIIISSLFAWIKGGYTDKKLDEYIYKTFQAFINNKKQITIALDALSYAKNKDMIDLILYSLGKNWDHNNKKKKKNGNDQSNLLRTETILMFKNVTKVVIDTHMFYCVSLTELLLLFSTTQIEQVIIKATTDFNNNSWIRILLGDSEKRIGITKQYKQKNLNIKTKKVKKKGWNDQDWLIISKM